VAGDRRPAIVTSRIRVAGSRRSTAVPAPSRHPRDPCPRPAVPNADRCHSPWAIGAEPHLSSRRATNLGARRGTWGVRWPRHRRFTSRSHRRARGPSFVHRVRRPEPSGSADTGAGITERTCGLAASGQRHRHRVMPGRSRTGVVTVTAGATSRVIGVTYVVRLTSAPSTQNSPTTGHRPTRLQPHPTQVTLLSADTSRLLRARLCPASWSPSPARKRAGS
jgi:hypothetical protein